MPWIASATALLFAAGSLEAQDAELTVERIASFPSLSGTPPTRPVWSPDGRRLAFLWNEDGWPFRELFVFDPESGRTRQITRVAPEPSVEVSVLEDGADPRTGGGITEATWFPDGQSLLFVLGGALHRVQADGEGLRRVSAAPTGLYSAAFSPDGRFASVLAGGDLWLWHVDADAWVRATDVGRPPIGEIPGALFSRPDAELGSSRWSADGRFVALLFDDRRAIRRELVPDYLAESARGIELRRDYPGDTDHVRKLALYDVERGRLRLVEVGDPTDVRIQGLRWSPGGGRLLADVSSEDGVERWLYLVDPRDESVDEIWHDDNEKRTTLLGTCAWRSDGNGVIFVADTNGRHHLHELALPSRTVERLTDGDWSVVAESGPSVLSVSREGSVYFVSTRKSPYERQVERVSQDGGAITTMTSLEGVHVPYPSPDGSRLAVIRSSDTEPPELFVLDTETGQPEVRVTRSPPESFYRYPWSQPRYVTFPSRDDGVTLHGRLLLPPDFDPSKRYPVVLGPVYPNTVRNQWADREEWRGVYSLFQQYLALQRGYIGFHVDIRGSVGYGREFHERLLLDYGGIDVSDLLSGVDYLKTLDFVDGDRIGLWGSSYGGLLTLLSLFHHPGVYRAGAAAAPVTDFRHVTTGVSLVVRRREAHPEAHRRGSAVTFGEELRDPLLILHGMQDSIVLFKDTVVMAERLLRLNKDFEWVVSPTSTHRWSDKDYVAAFFLRRIVQHFDRHLRGLP